MAGPMYFEKRTGGKKKRVRKPQKRAKSERCKPENAQQKTREILLRHLHLAERRWRAPRPTLPATATSRDTNNRNHLPIIPGVITAVAHRSPTKRGTLAEHGRIRLKRAVWVAEKKAAKETVDKKEGKEEKRETSTNVELKCFKSRGVRCCKTCGRYWNRDTAASLNILSIFMFMADHGGKRPLRFTPLNNTKLNAVGP